MSTNKLSISIVPAGAGSGKTHHIQEELTKRIKAGLAPEKIVAVTFTEAAAGELRGRISAALVKEDMLDEAIRLDQAYISTIHGFGLRLITEFAFDGGISPAPRLLNNDEQSVLVSQSLVRSEAAFKMMQKLSAYGYSADFNNNKSAEQVFRETIFRFLSTLRSIGRDTGAESLGSGIENKIRGLYGETKLAEHLKARLLQALNALLGQFPDGIAKLSTVEEKIQDGLQKEYRALNRAKNGDALNSDWKLWKQLGNLKTYKNPAKKFPSGYQELAEEVIAVAQSLPFHPGPLQDALDHAELLLQAVVECLSGYAQNKQQRSLLDFTDMVASARRLLCENDEVLECLKERVSCLVIDEFQDTNPLQFSLLWALTRKGVPTIIVGDLKQAIMGFQGADARLLKELCTQYPDNSTPLPGNWRTTERLMEWVNQIGTGLFGSDYDTLEPKAKLEFTSKLSSPLELVDAAKSLSNPLWASYLVNRLHTLITDENQIVYDKRNKLYRRLKGGDIAILCPTKNRMKAYAEALRNAGIRCRIQQDGWFASRIVQLTSYALAYVADPGDLHAKLYLAVTELGNHTIESALQILVNKGDIGNPDVHGKLEAVATKAGLLHVDKVLAEVINSLDLYGCISVWEDASQARVNLLRLQEECREFSSANHETMACGGYYSSDIKTFMAWLRDKIKREDGQPDPSVLDEDAVQLVTWHSSKGREWPVVAVCGLDDDFTPRLPATRVAFDDFRDLGALLDTVRVEILPTFDSGETNQKFLGELLNDAEESATRLLYVALTRTREKLILEWPSHHDATRTSRKNKSYWDLFTEKTGAHLSGGKMVFGEVAYDYYGIDTDTEPWIVNQPLPISKLPQIGLRALKRQHVLINLVPEAITPSSLHNEVCEITGERIDEAYGEALDLKLPGIDDPLMRGTILHRAFEVLSGHPERIDLLFDSVNIQLDREQSAVVSAIVTSFDAWLTDRFSPVAIHSEVPLLALDSNGSVVSGFADMIVETADGLWVADHKSDQVPTPEKIEERFNTYYPQVKCYADALQSARPDKTVRGIIINWISFGKVSLLEL